MTGISGANTPSPGGPASGGIRKEPAMAKQRRALILYAIALLLSLLVPGTFTAIAFDSGGVASGPLTSSFVLPMIIGACISLRGADAVMDFAFGMVAMVAMTPLITIQTLGFRSIVSSAMRRNAALRRILSADDAQIIYFE